MMLACYWRLCLLVYYSILCTADSPAEETHRSLYDKAIDILKDYPQAVNEKKYNNDNQVVMNVPIDYSDEYQISQNEEILLGLLPDQTRAYQYLQESSELGNVDATYMLGDINMYGNFSFARNGSEALKYYLKVAELKPNATAYFNIGFIYSTGLFGAVDVDQGKANLYYNFAFNQGDLRAGMVLGYRYLRGVSVESNCRRAEFYYQAVADKLHEYYENGPLGGPNLDSYSLRLADFQGGIYGKGVGDIKSSLTRKNNRYDSILSGSYSGNDEPVFDSLYWMVINEYEGSYLKKRNFKTAMSDARYVREHASKLNNMIEVDKRYAAHCIYIMGKMYLRGEGVEQDYELALEYFKESLTYFPLGSVYNDIGLIHEFGPESLQNLKTAGEFYKKATTLGSGLYNYGRWLINSGIKNQTSIGYIEAAYHFHDLQGVYSLIELNAGNPKVSCGTSVSRLRYYVENFDPVITSLEWSFFEMIYNRPENALIGYAMAAEQGYETAQASAAYLLYQLPDLLDDEPPVTTKERMNMAITYLTRSSHNSNIESSCVLGDIYCATGEYEKASAAYDFAATKRSSQAHFNLGWLHEHGYGSKKDFNMAKRHYDLSLSYNPKAYLVVKLALLKLRFKSFINDITGGKVNGISKDSDKESAPKSKGWVAWVELYQKVRDTNFQNDDNDENLLDPENDFNTANEESIDNDDMIVLAFFVIVMVAFVLIHYLNQRQRRMRFNGGAANAADNGGVNLEFNFIAI